MIALPVSRRFCLGLAACCLMAVCLMLSGCRFYSFTGATIPSHIQTVAIPIATDNSSSPFTTLGRELTDLLVDQFVNRTRLSLTTNETDADALVDAQIVGYQNQPTSVTGDNRAELNRVTIRVQVRYLDQAEDEELLAQTFSNSEEYDPIEAGLQGEEQAARTALERVAEDIFTQATSNW